MGGGGDVESGGGGAGSGGSHVGAVLAALGVGVCPLCFGFTVGFTSPTLPAMTAEGGALTLSQASTFTAAASLGGSVGSVVGGRLADSRGRKRTLRGRLRPFGSLPSLARGGASGGVRLRA